MKILFIIQKLYNGGAEHVIARLSSELSKRHEVYLALTDPEPYLKGKFEVFIIYLILISSTSQVGTPSGNISSSVSGSPHSGHVYVLLGS